MTKTLAAQVREQRRYELAKAAMQGILANSVLFGQCVDVCESDQFDTERLIAHVSLSQADAMLRAMEVK